MLPLSAKYLGFLSKKKADKTQTDSFGLASHALQFSANIFQWFLAENLWVLTVVLFSMTS